MSEWIKASDRLPEVDVDVLVNADDWGRVVIASRWVNEWWHDEAGTISVTHWMPLPEPPK